MGRKETSKVNPYTKANLVSKLFFWWVLPFLFKGSRTQLASDDLYNCLKEDQSGVLGGDLEYCWNHEINRAQVKKVKPRFHNALLQVFWERYVVLGLGLIIADLIFRVGQTLSVHYLISSFNDGSSIRDQYLYASGIMVATFFYTFCMSPSQFGLLHIGMKCRVAAAALIYRKALRLKQGGEMTVGRTVNLLGNDVNRFESSLFYVHYFYIGPIQFAIFMYLLWTIGELEFSALASGGFLIVLILIQFYLSKFIAQFRLKTAIETDRRSQLMHQVINAIRVIKMYSWEKPFSAMISDIRRLEIKALRVTSYLRGFYLSLFFSSRITIYFTILTVILMGWPLKSNQVFFLLASSNVLRVTMLNFVPMAVSQIRELNVSIRRIEEFLLLPEKNELTNRKVSINMSLKHFKVNTKKDDTTLASVQMSNASASWSDVKKTLKNLTVNLYGDQIVMVVGPVGSGKTSFLHTFIGELEVSKGKCVVKGNVAYASQEPWIFPASLRENVLFGRNFDENRFSDILDVCALEQDLDQLAFGQHTLVGERGVSLSGGQKARVNLGRALYQEADIYLLDDPLSAVDYTVSRHIFEKCIKNYLKGKLRILVTHQLQYLQQADHIIVLNDGKILAQGSYSSLVEDGVDFVSLVKPMEEDEKSSDASSNAKDKKSTSKNQVENKNLQNGNLNKSKLVSKEEKEAPKMVAEKITVGSVTWATYWNYLRAGNSIFGLFFLVLTFCISQTLFSGSEYWLSYWTTEVSKKNVSCDDTKLILSMTDPCEELDNYWYLYIYTGLTFGVFVATVIRFIYSFHYLLNSGSSFHNRMFNSLMRSPTKFFDENPSGRVLNRFTKDISSMDELLPPALLQVFTILLLLFGILVVIIISNYFAAVPAVALVTVLVLLRRFYIKTARQVKRIEAIARSPILTHLVTSVHGLSTIRSSNAQSNLIRQFDEYQDIHSAAWFLFIASQKWFTIMVELSSAIFIALVVYSFLILSDWIGSEHVGLVVSSALAISGPLQQGMRQGAETENHMTSVERALEYCHLEPEAPMESDKNMKPSKDWPTAGQIKFEQVSLSYGDKDVLKNLSFEIKAKENIGIVGRTGAGKSSMISALFRMSEPNGKILIDGVNIQKIGLEDLRSNISIIPQDPVLFSGTIRYNLDPFNEFPDDQLWRVIQEVELKEEISSLNFHVQDGGTNFSVGQRQLVCLARAILRQNQILVMDEATANVDPRTDNLIQQIVRTKFDCTLITIAHRLASVMDCDRIMVLDDGSIMEFDQPQILLSNLDGYFSQLAKSGQNQQ